MLYSELVADNLKSRVNQSSLMTEKVVRPSPVSLFLKKPARLTLILTETPTCR
jgi:hypothetical protein